MARYNEILVGRFARAVQKLFSMKGEVPIGSLAGELVVVHGFLSGAENRFLEGWNRYGGAAVPGPTAANTSCFRLRNPAGSNVIAVIEKVDVAENATDNNLVWRHGQTGTDLANIDQTAVWDTRGGVAVAATCVLSEQSSTPAAPAIGGTERSVGVWQMLAATNVPLISTDIQEMPLTPGDAYQWNVGVVNQRITASIWWRERLLEESERT